MTIANRWNTSKIKILFLCFSVIFSSCEKEEEAYLQLSVSEINFSETAEQQTINIYTNTSWQTSISPVSAVTWLNLSVSSGNNKDLTLILSVKANKGYDNRSAEIIFKSAAGMQTLRVSQQKLEELKVLSKNEYYIWQPGGKLNIDIEKNIEYITTISPDAQEWIQPISVSKGIALEKLIFAISENQSTQKRYGEIYIQGKTSVTDPESSGLTDTIKITQEELNLTVDPLHLEFGADAERQSVTVFSTHRHSLDSTYLSDYSYTLSTDTAVWCTIQKDKNDEDLLSVSVTENTTGSDREADIIITSSVLSDTIHVVQKTTTSIIYYSDKDTLDLQIATEGNGIDIVVMGDGFVKSDLNKGGFYETTMKQAVEYFFSIEPYHTYKEYFNVSMVVAESEEEGASDKTNTVNNKFGSTFGTNSDITFNADLCKQYAALIPGVDGNAEALVILVINSDRYAGSTTLYNNGFCISLCPISTQEPPMDFRGLIHHEAGGHGFGLFEDEYIYYNYQIPSDERETIQKWQQLTPGFYQNIDFVSNPELITWKDFIGLPNYSYVGIYEGSCKYQYGVWRAEENSCMNNNIPYYSAPCRKAIINRIRRLAGKTEFSISQFAEQDHVTPPISSKSFHKTVPPLGRPRRVEVY